MLKLYPQKSHKMKHCLLLLSVLLSATTWTQKADFTLLNCEPVKDDVLWASRTELTNQQYREFLSHIQQKGDTSRYNSLLPDTTVWMHKTQFNDVYVTLYFRHPAYNNYPIVGLTQEQAMAYCDWLEEILNDKYANDPKHPVQKIDVRLPTEKEWKIAARGGNPDATFPWAGTSMRHSDKKWQGDMRANFVRGKGDYMGVAGSLNDNADITAPAKSYWPNGFGLYNMAGNVAEMLAEKGRTKGGSWGSRAPYLEIDAKDQYEGFTASRFVGMRYFIEIIDRKPVEKEKKCKFTAKTVEKLLAYVPGDTALLASKYEVTNRLYNLFLKEHPQHQPNHQAWEGEVQYARQYINDYGNHPKYNNYPVVNIDKAAAIQFCDWLTKTYNAFPKKKYPGITFRLPTNKEWEKLAFGGLEHAVYPWGGPYQRNSKGCFLCNYNTVEERWLLDTDTSFIKPGITQEQIRAAGALDGLLITGPVDSYHPNGFGLYNMSGNAAEMVSDAEVQRGGSWGSLYPYIQIKNVEPYEGSSPFTGFRFVANFLAP